LKVATPRQIRRRGRWSLFIGVVLAALTLGAVYAYADTINADTDALATSPPNGNGFTGTQTVGTSQSYDWSVTVNDNGNSADDVFASGSTVSFTVSCSGPSDWTINCTNTSFQQTAYGQNDPGTVSVSIPNGTTNTGTQSVTVDVQAVSSNGKNLSPNEGNLPGLNGRVLLHYNITTATTTNTPPTVDAGGPYSGGEGSNIALDGASASDTDGTIASYLWSIDSSSVGTGSCSLSNATSLVASINCTDNGTAVVKLLVTDNLGATNSDTANVTINNVAPTVAVPTWQHNPIDCQTSATLQNISFSDPGIIDNPWVLNIDWGDNSTDYNNPNVGTQGAQSNQSHTYTTPGSYTATVDVTDKDGDTGTHSSAALTVNQVYTVSFLQPLDASTPAKVIGNTVKKGRVVPVKAIITDACTGLPVTSGNVTIAVKPATFTINATDAVETFSDAGSSSAGTTAFRYDATSGYWIYNLDTSGFSVNTPQDIHVKVGSIVALTNYAVITTTK
jgi:hypothetical protein